MFNILLRVFTLLVISSLSIFCIRRIYKLKKKLVVRNLSLPLQLLCVILTVGVVEISSVLSSEILRVLSVIEALLLVIVMLLDIEYARK